MKKNNPKRGFTLVEIIIYIALTSLIMTTCISTIFYTLDSSKKNEVKLDALDEINFLNQKIFWALKNSNIVHEPTIGTSKDVLKVDINGYPHNPLIISGENYDAVFLFRHYVKNSHEYIEWSLRVDNIKLASTTVEI